MLYLIAFAPDRPVGVRRLADTQGVSPTYLSKILTKLVKAGLIESASLIHQVMLAAEEAMERHLKSTKMIDLTDQVALSL